MRVGLRLRFGVAAALLVFTTVVASVWTLAALSRLSGTVTDTVRDSEAVTAVTSELAGGLEREDDAVLLILSGDQRGTAVLAAQRAVVDRTVAKLFDVLGPSDEREFATPLVSQLQAYRRAADLLSAISSERGALVQYHQQANPLLRRAVALTTTIRNRHFDRAQAAVTRARDEAASSRRAVLMITIVALGFAMLVAWHLTSRVVGPLRRLTRGANAIREGRFEEQIDVTSHDELAELASAFNQMATDLADFRRTNIGEVVRTKNILESTLAGLPDAVMLLDADRRIVSMNRAALDVCGAVGLETPLTLDDVHIQGLDCAAVDRAIATGMNSAPVDDLTRTIPVEQGSTVRRLLPRVVPVPEANGDQQRGAILLLSDVTDLVRLDEMRSELVAVASHELQTPLTTLRMTLLMLQESAQDMPERQRELVTTSLIGVGQLHEIIHEFLDLARIEAGELRLNLEPVRVSSLLEDVIRRLEPQAAAQDIELRSTIAPGLPTIAADERRIRMVVENLLSNALKYTPGGGVVSVSANSAEMHGRNGSDAVVIRVADTGPGVPVAFRRRIFEKFFRLEHHQPDYQRQPRGAGIGLYMCRQIIDMHGGTIECTESSGGHGACLVVVLPVDAGAVSVAAPFGSLTAETG